LDAVRFKLVQQKDPAAEKLADVLDELAKMVGAPDDEIVRYLGLYFGSDDSIIQGRIALLGMEVGQSYVRVNEARGHCHKIKNIYDKYLKRWFKDVLDPGEQQQLEWLFTNLSTADSVMIGAMERLTEWLTAESRQSLDDVGARNLNGANQRIAQARLDVRPAREALTCAMAQLRGLQADFIAAAGTV
jgi:hypothetical protein